MKCSSMRENTGSLQGLKWKVVYLYAWCFVCLLVSLATGEPEPSSNTASDVRRYQPVDGNPRITEHPQDDYFAKLEPATLNCKAEGDPPPNITWYRNGEPVETIKENQFSHRMVLDSGRLFFLRVIHSKNNHQDIGEYYCNATNIHGSAISRTANIQIAVLKDDFRQEPVDTTTAVGQAVTLHCKPPRGKPEPKVIWRKNGDAVQPDKRVQIQEDGDLFIASVRKSDIGEYLCLAINTGGEKQSKPAFIRVLDRPVFQRIPKALSVDAGKNAEFQCGAIGDPPIKVHWSKEGGNINFVRARIMGDKTLRIDNVEPEDEGLYICTAENAAGSTQATARLTVLSMPTFLIRPQDQIVARGRTVTLQCVARGNPPPTVFWREKSQKGLMFPNGDSSSGYSVAEDGTFRIEAVQSSDEGIYICEALNTRGQAYAEAKIQVIAHDPRPPPIIRIGPQNQSLPVDTLGLLRCQASGDPRPTIRWYKNGRPILTDPRYTLLDSGTLQISDLKVKDAGTYTCKAVSETGETTWEAVLMVQTDPSKSSSRSSATSSLPTSPTKPVVSDITDTSVHLSWVPGRPSGHSPVFAFYVEYFGYETTEGWVLASRTVKRESYTVQNLRPNTTYVFMIRAVNANGVGVPSPVSDPVRTGAHRMRGVEPTKKEIQQKLGGNVVELLKTEAVNSSAIKLTWQPLKALDILEGYLIIIRYIVDIQKLRFGGKPQSVSVPATVTTHIVTGLRSYSWYELCVKGYSMRVESRCSNPVKVQTEEEYVRQSVPGPPENVLVTRDVDSRLLVRWSAPKSQRGQSIITGYVIHCLSTDKTSNCSAQTNGHTYSVVIRRINPDLEYRLKVAALTQHGFGVWSDSYAISKDGLMLVQDAQGVSTDKPVTSEEPSEEDLFKKPWFIGVLIGVVGVMLWVILCIFSIWLCKKRKNRKKMKDQRYYTGVPLRKGEDCSRGMMYPPQYGIKDHNMHRGNELDLPPELRILLPPHGKKEQDIPDENIYKMAGNGNFPEMTTFYQKADPVAPYATTALIQQQHLLKQRQQQQQQQGMDHMFRPINQGYIQNSEGSGDSCLKPGFSSDSNPTNSRASNDMSMGGENLQSPTSDSGSHTTDENGLLIKHRTKKNTQRKESIPKHAVNLSEMLPPPPDHPPPSECGDPPLYNEVRGEDRASTRSPMSPVSFSQLSACSCPNPHTQTPLSGWNMPVYSDNECPRCCFSEKYYDPVAYCQDVYIKRTHSPHAQTLQHVNSRPVPSVGSCSHSPRGGTPVSNVSYQYSHPARAASHLNSSPGMPQTVPRVGDITHNKSNINRASHSSQSDNEAQPHSGLPCFQAYKITPKVEKDYRFLRDKEWGPEPAPPCRQCGGNDSGMGMEEDGSCMDRACQSSLPSLAPSEEVNESHFPNRQNLPLSSQAGYMRNCDSPMSEGADYATESDLEPPTEQAENWNGTTDHNTDCSSMRSSTCSSTDGTFLTEADFASAVARAAEMHGLTVVGTTVCDLNKNKKERRHRRAARPVSPGYSTDSNYGSIDVVHRPYPKSQRKKQMQEQGKGRVSSKGEVTSDNSSKSNHVDKDIALYDTPYSRPTFVNPSSPMIPVRQSSLSNAPQDSSNTPYTSYLQQTIGMPMKEDVV